MDYYKITKIIKDNAKVKTTEEDVVTIDLKCDSFCLGEILENLRIMIEEEIKEETEFNIDPEPCIAV